MEVRIRGVPARFRDDIVPVLVSQLGARFRQERVEVSFEEGGEGEPLHITADHAAGLDISGVIGNACAVHARQHGWWYRGFNIGHLL